MVLKRSKGIKRECIVGGIPNRVWCMLARVFLSNHFNLIEVREKMSIMAMYTTHGTWLVGSNFFIPWWSRIYIPFLLLRRRCRRLVPIWLVLLWGIISPIPISPFSISLVVIGGVVISISSLLILGIKLYHVYPNLIGWLRGTYACRVGD